MPRHLKDEHAALGRAIWKYYRQRCGAQVATAIKDKSLPHPNDRPCVDCGLPADEYEHRNYARPLDVVAVCHGCNLRRGPAELDPEVVIHHLRYSDDMPYENARLRRMGTSRFRGRCACCKDGKHYHQSHDPAIVEKPVNVAWITWNKITT